MKPFIFITVIGVFFMMTAFASAQVNGVGMGQLVPSPIQWTDGACRNGQCQAYRQRVVYQPQVQVQPGTMVEQWRSTPKLMPWNWGPNVVRMRRVYLWQPSGLVGLRLGIAKAE